MGFTKKILLRVLGIVLLLLVGFAFYFFTSNDYKASKAYENLKEDFYSGKIAFEAYVVTNSSVAEYVFDGEVITVKYNEEILKYEQDSIDYGLILKNIEEGFFSYTKTAIDNIGRKGVDDVKVVSSKEIENLQFELDSKMYKLSGPLKNEGKYNIYIGTDGKSMVGKTNIEFGIKFIEKK